MIDIAIYGAGGFGREVKTILDKINEVNGQKFNFLGFFDDDINVGEKINGYPILGGVETINNIESDLALAIAISDPKTKLNLRSKITNTNIDFPTIIHPNTSISDDFVKIGCGTIVCEGVILTCNITIGKFVILNLYTTVGHDTIIEDYCSFMPSVNISGEVQIENKVYVGTGSKIVNQLSIGENTIVGAGAVVSKSLPSNCTAVGIPAKPIKFH